MTASMEIKPKAVKSILVSQPAPENGRSPYLDLGVKYNLQVDFRPFIHVEQIEIREYRRQRINIEEFTSVILTSKNSVDFFFSLCKEIRYTPPQDTKYFCLTETIANYLQKFIIYRKRKVNVGKKSIEDLKPALLKYKKTDKFLLPCSNLGKRDVVKFLKDNEINFREAVMYRTISSDLSDLQHITYDVLVFFSPQGIESLFENFPNFQQNDTRIAAFGESTSKAVLEKGLTLNIKAPTPECPSMSIAIERYIQSANI